MIRYENECVGCTEMGMYCIGESCSNRHVKHYYCDECGEEADELYEYDTDYWICEDCLKQQFPCTD